MPRSSTPVVACLAALGLWACAPQSPTATPPVNSVTSSVTSSAAAGGSQPPSGDTSVPTASSVFPPEADTRRPDLTKGRSNGTLTPADEAVAMPLPGQNNDHSAPVPPAARASSP